MAADGQNAGAFRWRWVDAVRYVLALAVTALTVAVIVHAVRVLLRPDFLILRVEKSFVAVERGAPASNLSFALNLEFSNPSGHVAIFYEGVRAYFYGRANDSLEAEYFVAIPIDDISLKQHSTELVFLLAYPSFPSPDLKPYFELFTSSGNKGIPGGIVVVNGTLTVGQYSWRNTTRRGATYYCWPVAIGGDSSRSNEGDAECMDSPPAAYVILPSNP